MDKNGLPKGSGKLLKVREKSVKSQGILKWIFSGNPAIVPGAATGPDPTDQVTKVIMCIVVVEIFNFDPYSPYFSLQDLKVTWSKGYGRPITKNDDVYEVEDSLIFNNPSGRLLKVKKAKIPDETQSVEGYYTCKASLRGHQDEERQVHLTVVAPPVFTKDGRLIPMKATVGSNTEFMCKTYSHRSWAKPVVWLHDGKPIVGK